MKWLVCQPEEWYRTHPERMIDVRAFYLALGEVLEERGHQVEWSDVLYEAPAGDWDVCLTHHGIGDRTGVWHVKKAYVPGYMYVDRRGYGPWAEAALDAPEAASSQVDRWYLREVTKLLASSNESKWPQPELTGQHPLGRYVFVPLQVSTDTTQEAACVDQMTMLRAVATELSSSPIRVLVKRHPFEPHLEIPDEVLAHVEVVDLSVHDLIPRAEAVVTVNSGVGFEALMYGATVITCGRSDYQWATLQAHNKKELLSHLWRVLLLGNGIYPGVAVNYAAWFLRHYLVHADKHSVEKRVEAIESEVA